ncbi:hypothetical protein [Pedobacter sp. NJ-S-72]
MLNADPETSSAHAKLLSMLEKSAIEPDEVIMRINDTLQNLNFENEKT